MTFYGRLTRYFVFPRGVECAFKSSQSFILQPFCCKSKNTVNAPAVFFRRRELAFQIIMSFVSFVYSWSFHHFV